ncbi:hypothetical protein TeGR_g6570 [Tetraparma gracilis]|uniref:Uncharacterized protein n=1 Tax=Tetraparma gracilis TaxID=2962635 RepID=A0ABQ6M3H9_9STRA|nr:hypothetical protein TeGR_g6570 [Tetraparma gracilis]
MLLLPLLPLLLFPTLLSLHPLALYIDAFASPAECRSLLLPSWRSSPALPAVTARVGSLVAAPPHPAEAVRRTESSPSLPPPPELHVDTNNGKLATFATAILYLTTVPEELGGHTSLPLAGAPPGDPALVAAEALVACNVHHAAAAPPGPAASLAAAAAECAAGLRGARCAAVAGRLLLFYGRGRGGGVDARAWHRGEEVRGGVKVILPMLKEVPMGDVEDERDFRARANALVKHGETLVRV